MYANMYKYVDFVGSLFIAFDEISCVLMGSNRHSQDQKVRTSEMELGSCWPKISETQVKQETT